MYNSFADVKLFITETEFTSEIITDIGVLMKLQRNCLAYQNKESVENFRIAYQQKSPLTLAYTMISLLEQQPTNPLAMAMAAARNEEAFKKWETIFKSIFGQLLFIEGFASGLLKDKNSYDSERILEKCEQLNSMMIRWREDYEFDKNWEEIDTHVKDFVKTTSALSNSEKADFIKKLLDMYSKTSFDSYWICVFNKCLRITDYAYHCPNEANQLIVYSDKNSKILVYRSREAYTLTTMDFDRVQKVFDFNMRTGLFYSGSLDDAIQKELINKQVVRGDSFICIVDSDFKPEIRFTKDFKQKRAPGAVDKIAMVDQSDKEMDKITQRMLIIALP
ncbi:hypothetical protein CAEBREN_20576 [Caenorhabditis brenneri]|uniref:Uncharacterized protein n=1 Tax=Caenorhabditis brenneri TaxID=135651 RepID=G0P413_CAEBE|nr:hypothetical protein CAEBREN_20576 [Caenorhabditis brenneri]